MMVVCKRRKTCFVGSNPFSAIPEDVESNSSSERRDSVESSSSGGSSDGRGVTWTRGPDHDPLQGDWTLISNNNFDQFLAVNGAGPLSSNMVLRARINMVIKQVLLTDLKIMMIMIIMIIMIMSLIVSNMIIIIIMIIMMIKMMMMIMLIIMMIILIMLMMMQELDKQWRISYETVIRAKSIRGYNTRAAKMTENKYQLEVERPELLDDWDQRWVMSTLTRDTGANRMTLTQVAEKDQVRQSVMITTMMINIAEILPGQHHHLRG